MYVTFREIHPFKNIHAPLDKVTVFVRRVAVQDARIIHNNIISSRGCVQRVHRESLWRPEKWDYATEAVACIAPCAGAPGGVRERKQNDLAAAAPRVHTRPVRAGVRFLHPAVVRAVPAAKYGAFAVIGRRAGNPREGEPPATNGRLRGGGSGRTRTSASDPPGVCVCVCAAVRLQSRRSRGLHPRDGRQWSRRLRRRRGRRQRGRAAVAAA